MDTNDKRYQILKKELDLKVKPQRETTNKNIYYCYVKIYQTPL